MRNIILFGAIILIGISCTAKKNITKELTEEEEIEYFNYFTEATKQALTQNLKNAVELYGRCIEKYPDKAAPYYQVSNIYLTVKDFEKAKYFALKAFERDTANIWYQLNLANLYQYENNIDSVIYVYEKIVVLSNNPEYKYNLAAFYTSSGNVNSSMKILDELEEEYDGMKEIILMRHRNYDALNKHDSAIVQLEKLIKLFPNNFEHYGLLAEYLSEINRFVYAGEIYGNLLEIEPDNGLANISYGDYYLKQGLKDSALTYYKRGFISEDINIEDKIGILFNYIYDPVAIVNDSVFIKELLFTLKETYSEDSRPYTLAAEFYIKRQYFRSAVDELEMAIKNNAEAYIIWEQYIMISNYLGQYEKVENIYERAIETFPNEIKIHIYIAYSLFELKKFEKSKIVAEKGVKIKESEKEDKIQIMSQLADAYRGLEEYEWSDSIYETILDIDPDNLLIRNNYSYYLSLRSKNLERAEELSRLTIQREPKNPTYLDTYGWILFKMGNYKDAIKYIEQAIKNGAYNSSEVLDHYGDVALKLERCDEAIEAWNEALKYEKEESERIEEKIDDAKRNCK